MRVLHVDRHAILREGLRALLAGAHGLEQLDCVATVRDALELPEVPDLVVLGRDEADDAGTARAIVLRFPTAHVVTLTEGMPADRILDLVAAQPAPDRR